ncbi:MAG: glycoside hydrolase family 16 protein, partial [Bacteroidota bacterium]
ISLFSDAYNDEVVDTWRTEWSMASFEDVMIAGNAVKKYSELDFVGIETVANTLDLSGMTHVHVDVWSPDFEFFAFKLVDAGPNGTIDGPGSDDVEHEVQYPLPPQGQWVGYDIPLAEFVNLTTRENLAQYIFVGQPSGASTVFIDNIYFYSE